MQPPPCIIGYVTDVPPTPQELLSCAVSADPGWSDPYGGPQGVERHCAQMIEDLTRQAAQLGELRAFAMAETLKTHSVAEVAARLGVTRQAVERVAKRAPGTIPW